MKMFLPYAMNDPYRADAPPSARYHEREIDRLASLRGLYLDTVEPEPAFDRIARRAAAICGAPFATVTVVREHEQAYLGNLGMPGGGSLREESICAHTILEPALLVVEDLREDPRFADLPIVRGAPKVRFYAGVPLRDPEGLPLGSVCVLDTRPRTLDEDGLATLARLAMDASVLLEARRLVADLLGPNPHPVALHKALARVDRVLEPLFADVEALLRAAA